MFKNWKFNVFTLPTLTTLGAVVLASVTAIADPVVKAEFIFEKNPVPSCHASTIAETPDHTLVAAWFAGTYEKHPDVAIWSSRHIDGKWSAPVKIQDDDTYPLWNPVLFQPKEGPLMLFYKVGPSPSEWWGMLSTSNDHGQTWSEAKKLPAGVLGPIKNKPIQLPDGSILSGSSAEGLKPPPSWQIHFERSANLGKTWEIIRVPQPENAPQSIQPSILTLGEKRLLALGRTQQQKLFQTTSEDLGQTWSQPTLMELPNPNSGTDAVTLGDGRHVLIYNHNVHSESDHGRSPLNIAASPDGKQWFAEAVLENEPRQRFSYPAIIQSSDGLLHAIYTWKRKRIKHVVLDPKKFTLTRPIKSGAWPVEGQ